MEKKKTDDREIKIFERLYTIMSFVIVGMVLLMFIVKSITGIVWFPDNDPRCALLKKPALPMIFMSSVGYLVAWTIIRLLFSSHCKNRGYSLWMIPGLKNGEQVSADVEQMRMLRNNLTLLGFRCCGFGALAGLVLSYVI